MKVTVFSAMVRGLLNPDYFPDNSCPQQWACGFIWATELENSGLRFGSPGPAIHIPAPAGLCLSCLCYSAGLSSCRVSTNLCRSLLPFVSDFRFNSPRKALWALGSLRTEVWVYIQSSQICSHLFLISKLPYTSLLGFLLKHSSDLIRHRWTQILHGSLLATRTTG